MFIGGVLLLLALAEGLRFHLLQTLEERWMDVLVRHTAASQPADPKILIIDIDERSLARMNESVGRYPWPRAIHAELVEGLAALQPAAIVFDILFTDRDRDNPDSDRYFSEVLAATDHVYLPMLRLPPENDANGLPLAQFGTQLGFVPTAAADPEARVALTLPDAVAPAAWRLGLINFEEDPDGVGRHYIGWLDAHGWRIPSMAARVATDLGHDVPLELARFRLRWMGAGPHAFEHRSYSDVYEALTAAEGPGLDPQSIRDRIIIIGASAAGLHDLRVTPLDSLYPGVEILATALSNLTRGQWLHEGPEWLGAVLAVALLALLMLAFQRQLHPGAIGIALLALTLLILLGQWLALQQDRVLFLLTPLLFAWLYYLIGGLAQYLEERRRRRITEAEFKRTMDPRVVERLVRQGQTMDDLSGKSVTLTVLFSDIRGFTTLSEQRRPEEVVDLLNRYFSLQVETIFRHGGTLDKFIGDAIMAFWGAPEDDPDQACHAIEAALEMVDNLKRFQAELAAQGIEFDIGIGLHTGPAVVGFIGSETRKDYTAIGDTVNLASRLEGLTKGIARILVSEDTMQRCADRFRFHAHGSHAVKGRTEPVTVYEPERK
ncbi:MAG: adenylate/guanylate cyclase domain-containing protein [Gammaproteobacteria bacterium]|nr:MAG: adenylate/guanylate cyclase domain-containing protein [Gammaproteobacteria bacterium]